MSKPVTCGVFLICGDTVLICHPTGAPKSMWSIPKGIKDEGEDSYEAAIRELKEETGIDIELLKEEIVKTISINPIPYKNGKKTLKSYVIFLRNIPEIELKCESLIDGSDKPEMDEFGWFKIKSAYQLVNETQKKVFDQLKENNERKF